MIKCGRCLVTKEFSEFPPSNGAWCTHCCTLYYRERNNVKDPREDLSNGNRICSGCKVEKVITDFLKSKKCSRGYARRCKECDKKYKEKNLVGDKLEKYKADQAKWYRENKDKTIKRAKKSTKKRQESGKHQESVRKWQEKNPEKVLEIKHRRRAREVSNGNNDLTSEQIKQVLSVGKCFYCQEEKDKLVIEHQMPISRGGQNTLSNVVASCASCNNKKNNKTPEEYAEYLDIETHYG